MTERGEARQKFEGKQRSRGPPEGVRILPFASGKTVKGLNQEKI